MILPDSGYYIESLKITYTLKEDWCSYDLRCKSVVVRFGRHHSILFLSIGCLQNRLRSKVPLKCWPGRLCSLASVSNLAVHASLKLQSHSHHFINKIMMTSSMETFSALLAICVAQRPVTRTFGVFFDLRLNKRLSKQWWDCWFYTPSSPLWRHCNVNLTFTLTVPLHLRAWSS